MLYIIFLATGCGGDGNNNTPPFNISESAPTSLIPLPAGASLSEKLDHLIENKINIDSAGIAVLVMKDDEVVYQKNRGMSDKQENTIIENHTGFRIASISKTFTALAVMQLYEQNLLMLNDSVKLYLPELSDEWHQITIHHLLSHRSGIPDYLNDVSFSFWPQEVTTRVVMDYLISGPTLKFTPNSTQEYSNSGYVLLSQIVSRISGMPFSDYMETKLFNPFGMIDSYILDTAVKHRPSDALNNGTSRYIYGKLWLTPGASGQVSSTNDFQAFFTALLNEKIIKKETFALMSQTYSTNIFGRNYGYGLLIDKNNSQIFGHGGLLGSFVPEMQIHMGRDWQAIALNNNNDRGLPATAIDIIKQHYESND